MEGALVVITGVAFTVPLLIFAARSVRKRRSVREGVFHVALCVALLLFVNPFGQLVTLTALDDLLRARWSSRVRAGMSGDEVVAVLGAPCAKRQGNNYVVWDYTPLPFFWLSHGDHFRVFMSLEHVIDVKQRSKSFSAHSASLKPTSTVSPRTSTGRFTSFPSALSASTICASLIASIFSLPNAR